MWHTLIVYFVSVRRAACTFINIPTITQITHRCNGTCAIEMTQKRRLLLSVMLHRHQTQSRKHLPHTKTHKQSLALYVMLSLSMENAKFVQSHGIVLGWQCSTFLLLSCCLFTFYDLHSCTSKRTGGQETKTKQKNELTRLILCICSVHPYNAIDDKNWFCHLRSWFAVQWS